MIKKSNLEHGMIVKTTGGRYGIVIMKDSTDENVIKFVYEDRLLDHGFLYNSDYAGSVIVPLADFQEDLTIRTSETKEELMRCGFSEKEAEELKSNLFVAWAIEEVYDLNLVSSRQVDSNNQPIYEEMKVRV